MDIKKFNTVNEIYTGFMNNKPPDTVLLHYNETTITAGVLRLWVDNYTVHLSRCGVKAGTVIGYTLPNCPEVYALFFATSLLGGCCVPLFMMIPDAGKANIFKRSGAALVVTTAQQYPAQKEAADKCGAAYRIATIDANSCGEYSFAGTITEAPAYEQNNIPSQQPLLIASSSGTTGVPKQVVMTQSNIAAEIMAARYMAIPADTNIKTAYTNLNAFPLSTAGVISCAGFLFSGSVQIFSADLSPVKILKLLEYWKPDCLSAPPAYLENILHLPMLDTADLSSVKIVQTGMDFFTPALLQRLKDKFVNISCFANGYGLIETSNIFMCCKAMISKGKRVQPGYMELIPEIGNSIAVHDEDGKPVAVGATGELYVSGPNVVSGYAGNPEETALFFRDGWFKTGDIVCHEDTNHITLLGRQKHLIKRGGKSISPIVVQNHINEIPGIIDSAVTGIPHPLYGEMIWAFVVTAPGSALQLKDVMRHCRGTLPNYMIPDSVMFIESIPKNPGAGKVNFEMLQSMAKTELLKMEGGSNG